MDDRVTVTTFVRAMIAAVTQQKNALARMSMPSTAFNRGGVRTRAEPGEGKVVINEWSSVKKRMRALNRFGSMTER